MNAAMHYLKLTTSTASPIIRIAMGPDGTNFAFIELRTEEVRSALFFFFFCVLILSSTDVLAVLLRSFFRLF